MTTKSADYDTPKYITLQCVCVTLWHAPCSSAFRLIPFLSMLFPNQFALTQASRDAVAKTLYDRVFRWVVRQVNQLLAPTSEDTDRASEIG